MWITPKSGSSSLYNNNIDWRTQKQLLFFKWSQRFRETIKQVYDDGIAVRDAADNWLKMIEWHKCTELTDW